jgi:hypothetical protein
MESPEPKRRRQTLLTTAMVLVMLIALALLALFVKMMTFHLEPAGLNLR